MPNPSDKNPHGADPPLTISVPLPSFSKLTVRAKVTLGLVALMVFLLVCLLFVAHTGGGRMSCVVLLVLLGRGTYAYLRPGKGAPAWTRKR